MTIKRTFFFILLIFSCALKVQGEIWITVGSGLWSDDSIWLNGVSPYYKNSDSVIIKHNVELDSSLFLERYAYLQIDSSGAVCGHRNITIYNGAFAHKYGELRIDTTFIMGGDLLCECPGLYIYRKGYVHLGGSVTITGCLGGIMIWYECFPTSGIQNTIQTDFSVYPNPASEKITIELAVGSWQSATIVFYDFMGRSVLTHQFIPSQEGNETSVDMSSLSESVYTVVLFEKGMPIARSKIVVRK